MSAEDRNISISFTTDIADHTILDLFDYLSTGNEYDYTLIINSPEGKDKLYCFNKEDISRNTVVGGVEKVTINIKEIKTFNTSLRLHEVRSLK